MRDKKTVKFTQLELEALIERYFECETSETDEILLKTELMNCAYESPIIDDARVAMGFFEVGKSVESEYSRGKVVAMLWRVASVAAVLLAVVTLGLRFYGTSIAVSEDSCIAYVNGREVCDEETVLSLMKGELADVNDAVAPTDDVIAIQLSSLREVMKK